ncbi:RAD52 motif-containing protein 1-like [Balaenoptera ricei]|uniref:RAD52 motif-containing protein 1-like n=1 Tax=Balaenoptera ricei TaxID=2746895 RepID=UPI0028BE7F43|nr:RAD52 motif-containing protein 1-like [Balaenoptera ricei]
MVSLVPFVVPIVGDKTLLVWELSSGPTAEALQHPLFTVFSQFGLQYSVRVVPNAAVAGPVFYAIIKVYSARDAHRAQKACDQKQLFQASPVKLQDLSNLEERENEDIVTPLQKQSLKLFCALEVALPSHECRSPGVGMAEEPLDELEEVVWNQTAISLKSAVSPMSGILQLNSAYFNPHHFIPGPPQLQAACQSLPNTFCLPAKSSSFCRMWLSGKDTD